MVISKEERKALWKWIIENHGSLAKQMMDAKSIGGRYISLSAVSANSREFVWNCVKKHNAALASMLTEDPVFTALRDELDGSVELLMSDIVEAIRKEGSYKSPDGEFPGDTSKECVRAPAA